MNKDLVLVSLILNSQEIFKDKFCDINYTNNCNN